VKRLDGVIEQTQIKLARVKGYSLNLFDKEIVIIIHKRGSLIGVEQNVIGVKLELGEQRPGIIRRKLDTNLHLVVLKSYKREIDRVAKEKLERDPIAVLP
jgi:hypothetical protein